MTQNPLLFACSFGHKSNDSSDDYENMTFCKCATLTRAFMDFIILRLFLSIYPKHGIQHMDISNI